MRFPSAEWLEVYVDALNGSAEFADAASTFGGSLAYVFEAQPEHGLDRDIWSTAVVDQGRVLAAEYDADPAEAGRSDYVLSGLFSTWKSIVTGELDPIEAMLDGHLDVSGHLPTLLRHVRAATELVGLAGTVPTDFADESPVSP